MKSFSKIGVWLTWRVICLLIVLIVLVESGTITAAPRPFATSPLEVRWNQKTKLFDFSFWVRNDSPQAAELTAILVLNAPRQRRWRGMRLPAIEAGSQSRFRFSLPAQFMLKDSIKRLQLKIYKDDYRGFLDKSARYQRLIQKFNLETGQTSFEEQKLDPKTRTPQSEVDLTTYDLADPQELKKLLAEEVTAKIEQVVVLDEEGPDILEPPAIRAELSDGKLVLHWDKQEAVDSYNLYWSHEPTVNKNSENKIQGVESGMVLDPEDKFKPYYYVVTAQADGVESLESQIVSTTPQIRPPEPPLPVLISRDQSVKVEFQKSEKAKKHHLYWSRTPGVTKNRGNKIEDIEPGFVHQNLINGSKYYYVLTAENQGGESHVSEQQSATPQIPPPGPPSFQLKAGDTKIGFRFPQSDQSATYQLYWSNKPGVTPENGNRLINVVDGFEHTGLDNGKAYYYVMTAVNQGGESDPTPEQSATPKIPALVETPVSELIDQLRLEEFTKVQAESKLLYDISDPNQARQNALKSANELEVLDIASKEKLIALYIAEGKTDSLVDALSSKLVQEPENLNLSLSLSKVLVEQGDMKAALNLLNASLNRVSLSARVALNQELKTKVQKGATTLKSQSEESFLAEEFARIGKSLLQEEKFDEALSAFQSLDSLAPDFPLVEYHLGLSRKGLKQFHQAKSHFLAQSDPRIDLNMRLLGLKELTETLPFSLEIPVIQKAIDHYTALPPKSLDDKGRKQVAKDTKILKKLLAKAEKIRLAGLPDLKIEFAESFAYEKIQPGQDLYFDFKVVNLGKKKSQQFKVNYQLRHQNGSVFEIGGVDRFKSVDANKKSLSWNKKIALSENLLPGDYALVANIEQIEGAQEVSLENNRVVSASSIEVIPPFSDLRIQFAKVLTKMEIAPSDELDLELIVTNQGYQASPAFQIQYLFEHENGGETKIKDPELYEPLKGHNQSRLIKKKLKVPKSLRIGTYKIAALIQPEKPEPKASQEHKIASTGLDFYFNPPFTDLAISFYKEVPKDRHSPGEELLGKFRLQNYGNRSSGPVLVRYVLLDEKDQAFDLKQQDPFPVVETEARPLIWERLISIPRDLPEGRYRVVAEIEIEDDELEKNRINNRVLAEEGFEVVSLAKLKRSQSAPFKGLVGKPALKPDSGPAQTAEAQAMSSHPEPETPIMKHLLASGFTLVALWQSRQENERYQQALQQKEDLSEQRKSTGSALDLAEINRQIKDYDTQVQDHGQRANLFEVLTLVGLGWESYNLFAGGKTERTDSGSLNKNRINPYPHLAFSSVFLAAIVKSRQEQDEIQRLQSENTSLKQQRYASQSDEELLSINRKLTKNSNEQAQHTESANLYDAVAVLALGFESYLLYSDFLSSGTDLAFDSNHPSMRFGFLPGRKKGELGLVLWGRW